MPRHTKHMHKLGLGAQPPHHDTHRTEALGVELSPCSALGAPQHQQTRDTRQDGLGERLSIQYLFQ